MSFSPIVLFAYNRPTHTQRTLDALSSNPEAKESDLYIYCDGPKSKITDNDFNKIKQVADIAKNENRFKTVEVRIGEKNNGLANSIVSGGTSATVTASAMTVVRDGSAHSTFTSDGITLSQGNFIGNLTGNAVTANYADLAEKYTAQEDLIPGTVVCISSSEEYEVEPSSQGRIAVGVISTDPALLMNDGLEGGVAVALKGRVPTRIMGAVKKGQAVYIFDNGTASTAINGGSMVGVALESNSSEEEKLVECILKV